MAATDPLLQTATDAVGRWINQSVEAGWLPATARQRLESIAVSTPSQLFDSSERPLVVGLFGGTGVGKSTLLNRIAGQDIARASAERPTSRAVTAYLHHSRHIDRLPTDFPMDRLATALHHEDRWRDILWLDMPDVDSVEEQHRELVLQWLPYTDVLLYVVSPERYRDSRGWSMLQEHSRDHAWLFVFNQRDRGSDEQLRDLRSLLAAAGFADPAVFATSSAPGAEDLDDDFEALVAQLVDLSDRQLIEDLARRGVAERLGRVFDLADELANPALNEVAQDTLQGHWTDAWARESAQIGNSLRGRIPSALDSMTSTATPTPQEATARIFDEAGTARIDGVLASLLQELDVKGSLPRSAAQKTFDSWRQSLPAALESEAVSTVGEALAQPGTALQRLAERTLNALTVVLPTMALGWASWRVLDAFRAGATDPSAYLGVNFAVTAGLLVGIAWLAPWWLARRVRPSMRSTLTRGLGNGIDSALDRVEREIAERFVQLEIERATLRKALQSARTRIGHNLLTGKDVGQRATALPEPLRRLVSSAGG